MSTNKERIRRAAEAMETYMIYKGKVFEDSMDQLTDLMADLLHLAAKYAEEDGNDPQDYVERALRVGKLHFEAEHGNKEEEP